MKKFFSSIAPLFSILLFAAALRVLDHELAEYHYQDIIHHIGEISGYNIALALALTVVSYLVMNSSGRLESMGLLGTVYYYAQLDMGWKPDSAFIDRLTKRLRVADLREYVGIRKWYHNCV